jgi:hypothetical protein
MADLSTGRLELATPHRQKEFVMSQLSLAALTLALLGANSQFDFEDTTEGHVPKTWKADKTGEGSGSVWKVIKDESSPHGAHVLAQTSSEGPSALFNLCVANEPLLRHVDIVVSLQAISGKTDQGGGVVWRYRDANNYYVARVNPLEDNFRIYKVVDGKRMQLGSATVDAPTGTWHTLRIVHRGDHMQGFLNGKLHLEVKDQEFKNSGRIGLRTKADAVTSFDGLKVFMPVSDPEGCR